MTYRSDKLLRSAKDRPCVLCGSVGTTVAAHSNSQAHGRGFAYKAPDYYTCMVCHSCHDKIDGRAGGLKLEEKRELWLSAFIRTVAIWFEEGIVVVKGDKK
jgi:hypothetical protein